MLHTIAVIPDLPSESYKRKDNYCGSIYNRYIFFTSIVKTYRLKFIVLVFIIFSLAQQVFPQSIVRDSSFHPYKVNYWVTGPILSVGILANYLGIDQVLHKEDVSLVEIQGLNKSIINGIDRWSLNQDPSELKEFGNYSDYTLMGSVVLPALLLFDKQIRRDWFDILFMYMETMSISTNIYEWSFLGPVFQNRLRPITYYDQLSYDERKSGANRNSFYSGHVASVATATFFMVKVYCDYNPEIGNNKYLLYSAALIPPLVLGYFRIKSLQHFPSDIAVGIAVGALCGIIIPELHRLQDKNISVGMYSSPEATGIALKWQPDFLK